MYVWDMHPRATTPTGCIPDTTVSASDFAYYSTSSLELVSLTTSPVLRTKKKQMEALGGLKLKLKQKQNQTEP
jgi:hypothetical protein